MNVLSVMDAAQSTAQSSKVQTANGGADFAEAMESVTSNPNLRIFTGAPDYVVEWANKYNVHISKTNVAPGKCGPYTPAVGGVAALPTVHITPTALARMENDPEFRDQVEKDLERMSVAMHRAMSENDLEGTSITIHEDGSFTFEITPKDPEKRDNWEEIEALMKKVDQICEAMHAANMEKVERQLNQIQQNRSTAEFQRIRVSASPELLADSPELAAIITGGGATAVL